MRRRTLRTCLSVMLIVALSAMLPLRATMAMPAMAAGPSHASAMTAHTAMHGAMHLAHALADLAAVQPGHAGGCDCGVHCALCGVCHSTVSTSALIGLVAPGIASATPSSSRLTTVYLSPEPYPPRA